MSTLTVPQCPPETCKEFQDQINQACHELNYPPGHPILIAKGGGAFCYCTCGGGVASGADAVAE